MTHRALAPGSRSTARSLPGYPPKSALVNRGHAMLGSHP
jgi:hypothetical protein